MAVESDNVNIAKLLLANDQIDVNKKFVFILIFRCHFKQNVFLIEFQFRFFNHILKFFNFNVISNIFLIQF